MYEFSTGEFVAISTPSVQSAYKTFLQYMERKVPWDIGRDVTFNTMVEEHLMSQTPSL